MIRRLQVLRFFAALLVLVGHTLMEALQHRLPLGALAGLTNMPWGVGVDIFFVISGFIIATASIDRPEGLGAAGDFMMHRVIRLWPIYVFFTVLMLIAVLVVPGFLRHARLDGAWIVASFLFFPWPRPDDGRLYPVLGQGWTLNYEMFFYLSFAAVLLMPRRRRVATLFLAGGLLVVLGQLFTLPSPLAFYSRPVILEFLFGIAISLLYRRVPAHPLAGVVLIGSALAYLVLVPVDTEIPWRPLYAGIPAGAIVAGMLLLGEPGERVFGSPLLVLLGNASYALYLCHTFAINGTLWLAERILPSLSLAGFLILAIVSSLAASVITYGLVEKPFLRLLKPRYAALRHGRGQTPADLQPS